jgi:ATP-dependent exoDNAse (exonuclease V) beta subunit
MSPIVAKIVFSFQGLTKTFSLYRSSAGSGKTRTLARAYLKLMLQYRADYFKHILAVTFTNKASQEMKNRILEYLDNFARGCDNELAEELRSELGMDAQTFRQHSQEAQSTLLHQYDNFGISTIDAFFQRVIRSFTREAGHVGDYRLEVDQDAVLEEVIDSLIDELGANRELTDWVVEFARENLENERSWDVRYNLMDFGREIFREEFKGIEEDLLERTKDAGFFRALIQKLRAEKFGFMNFVRSRSAEALKLIAENQLTPSDFKYSGGPYNFFRKASRIASVKDFGEKEKGKRAGKEYQEASNWADKATRARHVVLDLAEKKLIPLLNEILRYWDDHYQAALSAEVALNNFYAFGLLADISRKLKEYKDENNLMLLADAPKFLNGVIGESDTPFIYEKVGSFYRNYLIDEFQDTSGLQWQNFQPLIINSLDQGYPSLVVGDVKQAIYRWRGGDLNLLQEQIAGLIGADRIDQRQLATNFRSTRDIVLFNNALFRTAAGILSLEADISAALRAYADVQQQVSNDRNGLVSIQFIRDEPSSPDDTDVSARLWRDIALEQIPLMLEDLQHAGVPLKDIAILVRKNEEGQRIASWLLEYKNSVNAKPDCSYDVVSNESLRIDGAPSVNLLLAALRYLLNADDSIARAQLAYEFARLREAHRNLAEVFAVSNQSIFENNLPEAFTREKPGLKKLPLVELTETLIGIFDLGKIVGELVYLQAFQDLVLEFSSRERNDLGAFLDWWEVNRNKKSIQVSGEVNAVQILTIHKSKGLQFPYVLIPFCAWTLDHENWQAPNLWVTSGNAPFDGAGFLPVKYSKTLEDTFFSAFYREERMKVYLDNLNLLYVAFTRAERGMMVLAPAVENRGARATIAGVLHQSIQADDGLRKNWDEASLTFKSGDLAQEPSVATRAHDSLALEEYLSTSWRKKLVIRQNAASWFADGSVHEKTNYGIYMHTVLSRMQFSDQLGDTLSRMADEGLISQNERVDVERQLTDLLQDARIADWFSRKWIVRTEVPILLPDGSECRMDRLITRERKAVVIDYKTGAAKKSDEKQVLQYMEVLRRMNFPDVEGYLLYLGGREIVEVKPGAKPKVIQKARHKDQLDLGF